MITPEIPWVAHGYRGAQARKHFCNYVLDEVSNRVICSEDYGHPGDTGFVNPKPRRIKSASVVHTSRDGFRDYTASPRRPESAFTERENSKNISFSNFKKPTEYRIRSAGTMRTLPFHDGKVRTGLTFQYRNVIRTPREEPPGSDLCVSPDPAHPYFDRHSRCLNHDHVHTLLRSERPLSACVRCGSGCQENEYPFKQPTRRSRPQTAPSTRKEYDLAQKTDTLLYNVEPHFCNFVKKIELKPRRPTGVPAVREAFGTSDGEDDLDGLESASTTSSLTDRRGVQARPSTPHKTVSLLIPDMYQRVGMNYGVNPPWDSADGPSRRVGSSTGQGKTGQTSAGNSATAANSGISDSLWESLGIPRSANSNTPLDSESESGSRAETPARKKRYSRRCARPRTVRFSDLVIENLDACSVTSTDVSHDLASHDLEQNHDRTEMPRDPSGELRNLTEINLTELSRDAIGQSRDLTELPRDPSELPRNLTDLSRDQSAQLRDLTDLPRDLGGQARNLTNISRDSIDQSRNFTNVSRDPIDQSRNLSEPRDASAQSRDLIVTGESHDLIEPYAFDSETSDADPKPQTTSDSTTASLKVTDHGVTTKRDSKAVVVLARLASTRRISVTESEIDENSDDLRLPSAMHIPHTPSRTSDFFAPTLTGHTEHGPRRYCYADDPLLPPPTGAYNDFGASTTMTDANRKSKSKRPRSATMAKKKKTTGGKAKAKPKPTADDSQWAEKVFNLDAPEKKPSKSSAPAPNPPAKKKKEVTMKADESPRRVVKKELTEKEEGEQKPVVEMVETPPSPVPEPVVTIEGPPVPSETPRPPPSPSLVDRRGSTRSPRPRGQPPDISQNKESGDGDQESRTNMKQTVDTSMSDAALKKFVQSSSHAASHAGRLALSKQSSRFELPMDMMSLETLTPQEYLRKYCVVSSRRQSLYHKMFIKNKEPKKQTLQVKELVKALKDVLTDTLDDAMVSRVLDMTDVTEETQVDIKLFAGLAALSERMLYSKFVTEDTEGLQDHQKERIECADFFALDWKFHGVRVNEPMERLLRSL